MNSPCGRLITSPSVTEVKVGEKSAIDRRLKFSDCRDLRTHNPGNPCQSQIECSKFSAPVRFCQHGSTEFVRENRSHHFVSSLFVVRAAEQKPANKTQSAENVVGWMMIS
jgi:hypothetical protein